MQLSKIKNLIKEYVHFTNKKGKQCYSDSFQSLISNHLNMIGQRLSGKYIVILFKSGRFWLF